MTEKTDLPNRICNHCGVNVHIQPPKESGCNHVYYPEACTICSSRSRIIKQVIDYDWNLISTLFPEGEK